LSLVKAASELLGTESILLLEDALRPIAAARSVAR
jgi:hypothetical protein